MRTLESLLKGWIGQRELLLGRTLIRIKPTVEIFKKLKKTKTKEELENSLAQLKSEFR